MSETIAAILPYLQFLAGSGSGWVASWLFDQLRDDWLTRPYWPAWTGRLLNFLFYRPLGARITVFVFTAVIAVTASVLVALLSGQPILDAADTTIAALVAIVLGQVRHGVTTFPAVSVDLEDDNGRSDSGADR